MNASTNPGKFIVASICVLLISCSAARHTTLPVRAEDPSRLVLIIKESSDGQVIHDWRRAEEIDLSPFKSQPSSRSASGRIVLASSFQRDCDQELIDCHRDCMKRPVPPDYNQYEYNRGLGGRVDYCNKQCLRPYLDCKELEKLRPQEFSAMGTAVDWLKRHREAVLVGSIVVIAGVVFVVVSAGAGAMVLAPVLLVAS
jgi:hypothetical protein